MKNEYVIEDTLLDAIGEINEQWIEQAADYRVTSKIIPFPYKYAVVAANILLCLICAVAFSLTKLNKTTDPSDLEAIWNTGTEEPDVIITNAPVADDSTNQPEETELPYETREPNETERPYRTSEPNETERPYRTSEPDETERPYKTSQPKETLLPIGPLRPSAPVSEAPTAAPPTNEGATTYPRPTSEPEDDTNKPTATPIRPTETAAATQQPDEPRVNLPERPMVGELYDSWLNTTNTPSPSVPTQNPKPTPEPYPAGSATPTSEPPLDSDVPNKKYMFVWINTFTLNGDSYTFYSDYYKGYEIFYATDEGNIEKYVRDIIITDGISESVSGKVYRIKGIDPQVAVAVRYDGYEEYIIAVRDGVNVNGKLKDILDIWL